MGCRMGWQIGLGGTTPRGRSVLPVIYLLLHAARRAMCLGPTEDPGHPRMIYWHLMQHSLPWMVMATSQIQLFFLLRSTWARFRPCMNRAGYSQGTARGIDSTTAPLRHSCYLCRFEGSTGFPPFFSCLYGRACGEDSFVYKTLLFLSSLSSKARPNFTGQPARHPFKLNYFPDRNYNE